MKYFREDKDLRDELKIRDMDSVGIQSQRSEPGLVARTLNGLIGAVLGGLASLTIALLAWLAGWAHFGEIVLAGMAVGFACAFVGGDKAVRALIRIVPWLN